jgi:integrase
LHRRERVLSPEELRKVWQAFEQESERVVAMQKLWALTLQRKEEVAGMRWAELDLNSEWWTIPGERTKNKITQRVPLVGEALRIVRALKDSAPAATAAPVTVRQKKGKSEYVFVGRTGKSPFSGFSNLQDRVRERSGVEFRVHDLRRTATSGLAELGVDRTVIKKVLNHADGGVTAIYDRYSYDKEKRTALAKWDRYLIGVLAGERQEPAKVVPLHA